MAKLEPKTIDQILEVIRLSKSNYMAGFSIETSYREAIQKVADMHSVAYQTIGDGCRRRLGLKNMSEFSRLLKEYMNGNSKELTEILLKHTDSAMHNRIKQFFIDGGVSIKAGGSKSLSPVISQETKQEVLTFRLDHESARKLKALAGLEGLSVPEWISETIKNNVDQKLKEWAKSIIK